MNKHKQSGNNMKIRSDLDLQLRHKASKVFEAILLSKLGISKSLASCRFNGLISLGAIGCILWFGYPDLMIFVRGSLSLQFLEFSFPQQVRQQRQSKAKTPGLQSSCKSTAKQSRLKKHFAAVENRFNQVLDFWLQYSLYTAIQFLSDHFGWRHTHVGAPTTHQNKLARFQAF